MIFRYLKKFYNHLEISRICTKIKCNIMYNNNWYQEIQTAHQKGLRRDKCSAEKSTFLHLLTMWGPPVMERRFINPMNTIVIGTINHSYYNQRYPIPMLLFVDGRKKKPWPYGPFNAEHRNNLQYFSKRQESNFGNFPIIQKWYDNDKYCIDKHVIIHLSTIPMTIFLIYPL